MSVRRLLTEMDSYELSCWQAYLKVYGDEMDARHRDMVEDARIMRSLNGEG